MNVVDLASCEAGWSRESTTGNCYKQFDDAQTWYGSKLACKDMGADLATITSFWVETFITGKLENVCLELEFQNNAFLRNAQLFSFPEF